jgi:hypothetical protein
MPIAEAARLARQLLADPSSHLCAAVNEWEFPASREYLVLAEQFDLLHRVNAEHPGRVEAYVRPWPDPNRVQYGKGTSLPLDELRRTLDEHRAAVEAQRVA